MVLEKADSRMGNSDVKITSASLADAVEVHRLSIQDKIHAHYRGMTGEHHRYRSWEHCFKYFRTSAREGTAIDRNYSALQLGFYLASWGMYRGSSFLLQHAYTVHLGVIDQLIAPRFSVLWEREFGAGENDASLVPIILEAANAVREAYRPFVPPVESRQASDTLVTKIILGTFGCLPACDRYFIKRFKSAGFEYSYLNVKFIERVLRFARENLEELCKEQDRIERSGGIRYPIMKLVDMCFWQMGFELEPGAASVDGAAPTAL